VLGFLCLCSRGLSLGLLARNALVARFHVVGALPFPSVNRLDTHNIIAHSIPVKWNFMGWKRKMPKPKQTRKPGRPRVNARRMHLYIGEELASAVDSLEPPGRGISYKVESLLREALRARGIEV
jgi:hypothetical protein